MNPYPPDVFMGLAKEKIDRCRAEAESYRLAKLARPQRVRAVDRLFQAIGRLASIAEGFKGYRRPRLPAV